VNGQQHDRQQVLGAVICTITTSTKASFEPRTSLLLSSPETTKSHRLHAESESSDERASSLLKHGEGESRVTLNERAAPEIDKIFHSLGKFSFNREAVIVISNDDTDGYVVIDAVQLVPQ